MKLVKLIVRLALLLAVGLAALTIFFPQWLDFKYELMRDYRETVAENPSSIIVLNKPPRSWQIEITGEISPNARYGISVLYSATNDHEDCREYSLRSEGYKPKDKWLRYYPKIEQGNHSLVVPLNDHKPNSSCKYRPSSINLAVTREKAQSPYSDMLFEVAGPEQASQFHPHELVDPAYNVELDLECVPFILNPYAHRDLWRYSDAWSCNDTTSSNTNLIAQQIKYKSINLSLNISLDDDKIHLEKARLQDKRYEARNALAKEHRLVGAFAGVMNRLPSQEEGNQLLRRTYKMTIPEKRDRFSPNRDNYFELLNTLGEKKKDPWGKEFQFNLPAIYSDNQFEIISFGADGVLSDDDIWVDSQGKTNISN